MPDLGLYSTLVRSLSESHVQFQVPHFNKDRSSNTATEKYLTIPRLNISMLNQFEKQIPETNLGGV